MSEQQRELERLRAKVKPVIQSWIDNVIVPSLIAEWLARDESAKSLARSSSAVAQFEPAKVVSAEEVA